MKYTVGLFMLFVQINCIYTNKHSKTSRPRVCVIGAGIAGLTSARYLKEEGIDFTVLESTRYVGGTWRYDPRIGTDDNGIPLHTSMYKHLRTNLPKPTMELRGFKMSEALPSFPYRRQYYNYIQEYAKHFELDGHIKFLHNVNLVTRVGNMWRIIYENVLTNEEFVEEYDFVFVGTGRYTKPNVPKFARIEKFGGTIIHSHDYRVPDWYKDRRVLVVGAGPSGHDIGMDVARVSKTLVHSHHSEVNFVTEKHPSHYLGRPDVKEFNETGVTFVDGSYEEIDDVILCTGFQLYYPFLDDSCELDLAPNSVTPLYQYVVNINQPTMVLIGLMVKACNVVAIDAQARYATALAKGNFTLPPKEKMLEEWQKRVDIIRSNGRPISDIHLLAEKEDEYYEQLTNESGIDRVPPVMFKIRNKDFEGKIQNLFTYRKYVYTVIDEETFKQSIEVNAQ